jgi:hypothetical protein
MWEPEAEDVELEEILWKQVCPVVLSTQCMWEPEAEAAELEELLWKQVCRDVL